MTNTELDCVSFTVRPVADSLPLGLEIWLDDQCMYDQQQVLDEINFSHEFPSTSKQHQLRIVVKNKTPAHTVIGSNSQIISDSWFRVYNFSFNEINIQNSFLYWAKYHRENLPTVSLKESYGHLSFNGQVELCFTSPADEWCTHNYVY